MESITLRKCSVGAKICVSRDRAAGFAGRRVYKLQGSPDEHGTVASLAPRTVRRLGWD